MKTKTFSTTIVTGVKLSYDIKEALAKKFNCDVEYTYGRAASGFDIQTGYMLTYDWCSDISKVKNFEKDFMKVVNDTENKSKKSEEIVVNENRRAMDAWKFPKLNKVTGKTCNPEVVTDLLRVCTLLGAYAQADYAKGEYSMAWSRARDCNDIALVHNLYASGKFHQAAKALRELDTLVRDYVSSGPYNEMMKVY